MSIVTHQTVTRNLFPHMNERMQYLSGNHILRLHVPACPSSRLSCPLPFEKLLTAAYTSGRRSPSAARFAAL